jgi:hypothetical protein
MKTLLATPPMFAPMIETRITLRSIRSFSVVATSAQRLRGRFCGKIFSLGKTDTPTHFARNALGGARRFFRLREFKIAFQECAKTSIS